jgi:four helix bundle protein
MSDYRKLKVWQRTMEFVTIVYDLTKSFPAHELYGLISQIRRAATSIALNITEGATSGYDTEFKRFLQLAIRSANEVATGFEIAKRLGYCSEEQATKQIRECDEIAAMLQGLSKSLNRTSESPAAYVPDATELTTSD